MYVFILLTFLFSFFQTVCLSMRFTVGHFLTHKIDTLVASMMISYNFQA